MCVIYTCERHDQILSLWRAQSLCSLHVLHLDFHCDMRGLLIDRKIRHAYRIWDKNQPVDSGNFLTHAILENRVQAIRWVHHAPGGRISCPKGVKYESDLTALPHRFLLILDGQCGIPIHYEVIPYQDWSGLAKGEYLDIDWDFFASLEYPANSIQERVEAFLGRQFRTVPQQVYVCYSPEYSHPSRAQYESFISDLAKILKAEVVELQFNPGSPPPLQFYKKNELYRVARRLYHSMVLRLRKRGIY
jgi:hypothetical protein